MYEAGRHLKNPLQSFRQDSSLLSLIDIRDANGTDLIQRKQNLKDSDHSG